MRRVFYSSSYPEKNRCGSFLWRGNGWIRAKVSDYWQNLTWVC